MSLEKNKIFAAICIALITAWLTSFISAQAFNQHPLDKDAVEIEGATSSISTVSAKPKTAAPILHLIATADIARGKKLSKACAACHSFDKGGVNKVGPNLWNIINRKRASVASFSYSDAMSAKGGNWNYEGLNQFLWKPKKFIKGTNMNYLGIKKSEDRAAMIAWLRTLSASPAAAPSSAQIAKEAAASAPSVEAVAH